jgi:hypothetical protein
VDITSENWEEFGKISPMEFQDTSMCFFYKSESAYSNVVFSGLHDLNFGRVSINRLVGLKENKIVEIEEPDAEIYYFMVIEFECERARFKSQSGNGTFEQLQILTNGEKYWEIMYHVNPTEFEFLVRVPQWALGREFQTRIIASINLYNVSILRA